MAIKKPDILSGFFISGARLTDLVLPIPCAIFLFLLSGD
ncbi:hypothetical protein J541_4600, partial [Acinetobacter pittii]